MPVFKKKKYGEQFQNCTLIFRVLFPIGPVNLKVTNYRM